MEIYRCTCLINNKIYIGKTKHNIRERQKQHKLDFKTNLHEWETKGVHLTAFHNAVKLYGWENFKFELIEICTSLEHLNRQEKYWIKLLDSRNDLIGYNIGVGGEGGDNYSNNPNLPLIKEKISKGVLLSERWTEERRIEHSKNFSGENNPMRRNPQNSSFNTDNPMKKEEFKKYGKKNPMADLEIRKRHLEALGKKDYKKIGEKISLKTRGRKQTEEHKQKNRESKRIFYYVQFSLDEKIISIFDSSNEVIEKLEIGFQVSFKDILTPFSKGYGFKWKRFLKNEITKQEIHQLYR